MLDHIAVALALRQRDGCVYSRITRNRQECRQALRTRAAHEFKFSVNCSSNVRATASSRVPPDGGLVQVSGVPHQLVLYLLCFKFCPSSRACHRLHARQ